MALTKDRVIFKLYILGKGVPYPHKQMYETASVRIILATLTKTVCTDIEMRIFKKCIF